MISASGLAIGEGGCTRFVQAACAGGDGIGQLDLLGALIFED